MQHRQKSAVSLATCWLPKYWLGQGVKSEETIRTSLLAIGKAMQKYGGDIANEMDSSKIEAASAGLA